MLAAKMVKPLMDAARLLPPDVAMHTTRVPFENPTTPDTLRRLAGGLTGAAGTSNSPVSRKTSDRYGYPGPRARNRGS